MALGRRVFFFLRGPPLIQKTSPNKNPSTPSFRSQNGTLKPPLTLFRWHVPNLEMLSSGDILTRHIHQFHHAISKCAPKLVHWFVDASQGHQFFGSWTHFCRVSQHSLEFDYMLPFKEYSTILCSTARGMYRYAQAEVLPLHPPATDNLDE